MRFFHRASSYLALDIGTEVVKALVFRVDSREKKGVVLGVGRHHQKQGSMRSGAIADIQGVMETVQNAREKALSQAKEKSIKGVVMGIAGELVKGTTTTVHYERIRPDIRIDVAELKEIVQQVQEKAYERIRKQLSHEMGRHAPEVKLINASIMDVRIDGYRVKTPIGFQGKRVSMSIFNAYAPLVHTGALEKIAEELELPIMSILAEPYAVARAVMQEDDTEFHAIFVDIGGGTTDVAVVRGGSLDGTKMYALGGQAFTKHLAQEKGMTFQEAERLKFAFSAGEIEGEERDYIHSLLAEDSRIWAEGLEVALTEFSSHAFLPSKILLCGGGAALPEIHEALLREQWRESLPFAQAPAISFLQPRNIHRLVDTTGELRSFQDITPMSLASMGVELLSEEPLLAGILRRTMKKVEASSS